MAEPILEVRNLIKTYPNGTQALKGVSFQVRRGEFLAIIGLSGSGKSTLLRCLNRLQDPTAGEIFFHGQDIGQIRAPQEIQKLRRRIGMIFQHFNLISRHTVLSNVLMGRLGFLSTLKSLFGVFSEEDRARALKALSLVGISEKAQSRVDQLSGGQQQRVAIARTLTQDPEVILADEPVSALDPSTSHSVMDHLQKVNRELGITVIANLHFLSLVQQYATRVIALKSGQVVFDGDPSKIDEAWFERIYGVGAQEVFLRGERKS